MNIITCERSLVTFNGNLQSVHCSLSELPLLVTVGYCRHVFTFVIVSGGRSIQILYLSKSTNTTL